MKRVLVLMVPVLLIGLWATFSDTGSAPPSGPTRPPTPAEIPDPDSVPDSDEDADFAVGTTPSPGSPTGREAPARTLTGTVVDNATSRPIAGARVRILHRSGHPVSTDAHGRYELAVHGDSVVLRVEADRYPIGTTGVKLSPGPTPTIRNLRLVLGAIITGRVTDGSGRPVIGARISEVFSRDRIVLTSADGTFRYPGARTVAPTEIRAELEGHVTASTGVLAVESGGTLADVTLVLSRPGRICGRVVTSSGVASAGTRVWIGGKQDSATDSDCDGNFVISPVPHGRATLRACSPDEHVAECHVSNVPAGGEKAGVLLRLGGTLSGKVLDGSGDAVPGARLVIRLKGSQMAGRLIRHRAGPRGDFRLEVPFATSVELVLLWPQGGPAGEPVRVRPGDEGIVLQLPPLATLAGRVSSTSGDPITEFQIVILLSFPFPSHKGKDGRFRIETVPPGPIKVLVSSKQGWAGLLELNLAPGEIHDDLDIVVKAAPRISCRVLDASGAPVAKARVSLHSLLGFGRCDARTDTNGRVALRPNGPGEHIIGAGDEAGRTCEDRPIEIRAGEDQEVTLHLEQ